MLQMYFALFLSLSLLNFAFTQEKEGDGVAKVSVSIVLMGHVLQMKFRPKTRSMIRRKNICFLHSRKQNGRGWCMTRKRV